MSLHSVLCRASLQSPVLELLASHVACLPMATAQQRIFAVQAAVNALDTISTAEVYRNTSTSDCLQPLTAVHICRCLQIALVYFHAEGSLETNYTCFFLPDQRLKKEVTTGLKQLCFELKSQGFRSNIMQLHPNKNCCFWGESGGSYMLELALLAHNPASAADCSLLDILSTSFIEHGQRQGNLPLKIGVFCACLDSRSVRFIVLLMSKSVCMQNDLQKHVQVIQRSCLAFSRDC